jgi:hypothetical protein
MSFRVAIAITAELVDNRGAFDAADAPANVSKPASSGFAIQPYRPRERSTRLLLHRRTGGGGTSPQGRDDGLVDVTYYNLSHTPNYIASAINAIAVRHADPL